MLNITASYSTLSAAELLQEVVLQYDIDHPVDCQFWHRGLNDSYKVTTATEAFFLRVYRSHWRALSDVKFEVDVLNHLHRRGAAVAYPIPRRNGGYITTLKAPEGARYAIVTSSAPGNPVGYENEQTSFHFGATLANIHALTADFHSENQRFDLDLDYLLSEPLECIGPKLTHRTDDWIFIEGFATRLRDIIQNTPREEVDFGFCHGDFHPGNMLSSDDTFTVFDFDCCGRGWRADDLAVFRLAARLREKESQAWGPFLKGYRSKRTITEIDLNLTSVFLAIRLIWVTGLHFGNANDFAHSWMDEAYIDRRIRFLKAIEEEHFN